MVPGSPALLSLFIVVFILVHNAYADTRYVSGILVVSVKEAAERAGKSIATVKTGDQVEVLEENGRFTKVRTKDNIEGWISSSLLQAEAPNLDTIARLKEEIAGLKKKNETASQTDAQADSNLDQAQKKGLMQSLEALKSENRRLLEDNQKMLRTIQEQQHPDQALSAEKAENTALKEKNAALQNDLNGMTKNSKSIVAITKERDDLKNAMASLQAETDRTRNPNQDGQSSSMIIWFIAGAAVFFAGLISSRMFTRRKSKLSF
jgi:SH3 domain protein